MSAFQDTTTVHACSTVIALLSIPVSELVSFAFSTIPIIMFNSQNFSNYILVSKFASNILQVSYIRVHDLHQNLYLKNTGKEGLELLRLLINKKNKCECCRMGLGHDIISGIGSLVVKGLTYI